MINSNNTNNDNSNSNSNSNNTNKLAGFILLAGSRDTAQKVTGSSCRAPQGPHPCASPAYLSKAADPYLLASSCFCVKMTLGSAASAMSSGRPMTQMLKVRQLAVKSNNG